MQTENDIVQFLQTKQTLYEECHASLGPLAIIVGPHLDAIEQSFVIINETRYVCDTPLQAVDRCFKATLALGCEYPIESRFPWIFLEKYVYEVSQTKVTPMSVTSLIADINRISTR